MIYLDYLEDADTQLGGTQDHIETDDNRVQLSLSNIDDDNDDRGEIADLMIGDNQVKADSHPSAP